jgi:hypothetical protein
VASPLLANLYLHYALDVWFTESVLPRMKKRCALVRFCDDFVPLTFRTKSGNTLEGSFKFFCHISF